MDEMIVLNGEAQNFNLASYEDKAKVYNAVVSPDKRVSDCVNEVINLENIYCEEVEVKNEAGEASKAYRIILFDDKGVSYSSVSSGIFSSVKNLLRFIGEPPYKPAIKVRVEQTNKGAKRLFSLRLV